jgi:hypothetical protein
MIKNILVEALNKMKAEEAQAVASAIANNKSTVVNPKFNEIEAAKNKAIAEVQAETNSRIADLSKEANEAKAKFEAEQKEAVTASTKAMYEDGINKLQAQIDSLGE